MIAWLGVCIRFLSRVLCYYSFILPKLTAVGSIDTKRLCTSIRQTFNHIKCHLAIFNINRKRSKTTAVLV